MPRRCAEAVVVQEWLRSTGTLALLLVLLLSGCRGLGQTPPPTPFDIDSLGTALALTENAPPPGFESVVFSLIDDGLADLPGYRYVIEMRFEGTFDRDRQPASGLIRAEAWWDGLAPARRVTMVAEGAAFVPEPRQLEGVRIVEDYYLVDAQGRCLVNVPDTARGVANLDAGSLFGGVGQVFYSGTQAVLNNVQAYRYDVPPAAAAFPAIVTNDSSALDMLGELWVAPEVGEHGVVVRYYVNADVRHVQLFEGEQPVSGQVFIRYDVFDLGVVPNISIPFGC